MEFQLTPELVTGDAVIDRQHREILARASALVRALEGPTAAAEATNALGMLAEYVYDHFDAEERLMVAAGYPGVQAHAMAHEALCLDFLRLAEAYREAGPGPALVARVRGFVEGAIVPHVEGFDRDLAAHLSARGAPPPAPPPEGRQVRTAVGAAREALAAARRALDAISTPACLLDVAGRIVHVNPAWDRFAATNDGVPGVQRAGLLGRDYLSCLRGDALVRRLGGVLRRALAGVPQEETATCHTAEVARILGARYAPVLAATGEVVGVSVSFLERHVLPIGDLYPVQAADPAVYQGPAGQVEACAGCGRFRRRDRAAPAWDFVPAYVGRGAPATEFTICDTCFGDQFDLTRG